MIAFLDTDVLIDCLRGTEPARVWLATAANDAFAIPGVVAMELVMGCRNQGELSQTLKFLDRFEVAWPDPPEFASAHALLVAHRLTSGLNIPDCLIAAMAV